MEEISWIWRRGGSVKKSLECARENRGVIE